MEEIDNTGREALESYARRFTLIFDYINRHLDEVLTVEQLSQVAGLSKFHFHRQFSQYCGITVSRYIQLLRLRRASYSLVFNPLESVTNIALDAGFENPESFSRAFKANFGQTPSAFRRSPGWSKWNEQYNVLPKKKECTMQRKSVNILNVAPQLVAALEHCGDINLVNDSARRFVEWRKETGLSPTETSQTYGIPYSDPAVTSPEEFRFDICGSVLETVPDNPQGVVTKEIPGGRCAVVRHVGTHDRLHESIYYLYQRWLPESGEELRDFPVYFRYLNFQFDTPEHQLETDVLLPLK